MTVRCPEGHESASTDYCDTCGSPIGAASSPSGGSGAAWSAGMPSPGSSLTLPDQGLAAAATQVCPFCGGVNVADALFCEACGYDFTTGTPPLGSEPAVQEANDEVAARDNVAPQTLEEPPDAEESGEPADEVVGTDDGAVPETPEEPADAEVPDEPPGAEITAEPAAAETADAHDAEAGDAEAGDEAGDAEPTEEPDAKVSGTGKPEPEPLQPEPVQPEPVQPEPVQPEPVQPVPSLEAVAPAGRPRQARHTPPSRALVDTWVVELWVDPDWYAVQQTEEACPSAGVPDIVLLTRSSALIGRPSGSLGVRPEVDAGADSAVSRRHAQLTSDGRRWWIEDLGSSNGTFVGRVGEPIPTEPLQPGLRVEIDRDDRIYVGAWTRLALRQATESEKRGEG